MVQGDRLKFQYRKSDKMVFTDKLESHVEKKIYKDKINIYVKSGM